MLTREIQIGNLALGGINPVRIQSMTNTQTLDTASTVNQALELAKAGCELIRITARNVAEAENLSKIKSELTKQGCFVPLIADIHFQPEAALVAARLIEKVRVNPGNYVDRVQRKEQKIGYTEKEYWEELEKIHHRLLPLIKVCKEYGTAIRVGVNHGSLSERILLRYGDTPEGMVASAMEFIGMFAAEGFHKLVLSMKSSNVKTMIYSYRLLVSQMMEKGYDYPLHLGVTEAGAGSDARIKSAAGIGELLLEGLGDTIRVSLTENPVNEIPVAKMLCEAFSGYRNPETPSFNQSYSYTKSETIQIACFGSEQPPVTISTEKERDATARFKAEMYWDTKKHQLRAFEALQTIPLTIVDANTFNPATFPNEASTALLFNISDCNDLPLARHKLISLKQTGNTQPVVLFKDYGDMQTDELILTAAAEFSFFLTDGLINGICIKAKEHQEMLPEMMFQILQAVGLRRVKAEFIACPTCGRTSYDVEGTLKILSNRLSHLKHLKIGVMGCIVNGPGEMADADYGYVGAGMKKVNLYKGKQLVMKGIDESIALDELIKLIKEHGDWVEEE